MKNSSNYLTLFFIPSPLGMDWSSPANLAWSALKNRVSLKPRFMGHVFVEFNFGNFYELTGMVGKRFDYLNQLLIEGRGLGILYHSFDGRLEGQEELKKELKGHFERGKVSFVRFLLNDNQCERIKSYLKEYREKNVDKYYGLANRPLHGEGAGCSAFGASFLEVLGLIDEEIKNAWSYSVNIPLTFAGPPLKPTKVSLLKLMLGAGSWAKEHEEHQKIFFWDPDRMDKWVKLRASENSPLYKVEMIKNATGIVVDKSNAEVPIHPIWKQAEI